MGNPNFKDHAGFRALFSLIFSTLLIVNTTAARIPPSGPEAFISSSTHIKRDGANPLPAAKQPKVIILGGGVAGVIAARTLHENGIDDFVIVEARDELGGRMQTQTFGKAGGKSYTIERGANWIQGTQEGDGPANPIYTLAEKHGLKTQYNEWYDSMTTYDASGPVDYLDVLNQSIDNYEASVVYAGARVAAEVTDLTARAGYSMIHAKPKTAHASASEYYQFDWEYAQTPEESSLIATAWGNNYTYATDQGGFSDDNRMSIDQRGFKTLIQAEANTFLKPAQIMFNSTVKTINYSDNGVKITLANGKSVSADYALCTFSIGVLQNDDVAFQPPLPDFKEEAIQSMVMATYTKIFLQFPTKFWFDTEMALYADSERGRYPVWQSLDHENFFPGSGIVFVTVTGDFANRVDALSDAQVKSEVMGVVRSMFPNVTVPEPLDFYVPRWHSNPLFRGSYSNWPPSFTSQHMDNIRANVGRLYFGGEGTSRKYFGFLHGAYFEGQSMGQTIAACIKNTTCPSLKQYAQVTNSIPYELN